MSWNLLVRVFLSRLLAFCFIWFWLRFCVGIERSNAMDAIAGTTRTQTPTKLYYEIFSHFCISFGIIVTWLTMRRQPLALLSVRVATNDADAPSTHRQIAAVCKRGNWIMFSVHWEFWHTTRRSNRKMRAPKIDRFICDRHGFVKGNSVATSKCRFDVE